MARYETVDESHRAAVAEPKNFAWLLRLSYARDGLAHVEVSGQRAIARDRAVVARGSVRYSVQGQAWGPRPIAAVLMMAPLETGEETRLRGGGGSC